jgi:cephalosporin hydroxylase
VGTVAAPRPIVARAELNEDDFMEIACQAFSVMAGTVLGAWNKLSRRVLLLGHGPSDARFVPIRNRCWSSDLPWSWQFYKAVQRSKNRPDQPPINWKGVLNMKDPFSLAAYPLLLSELRPATIIEIGAYSGGSATWLADMMGIQDIDGRVYSFDINIPRITAQHPKVQFAWANSRDLSSFDAHWLASLPHPWLVIEDAHINVYNLLKFFSSMMQPGDYLVAEDTLHYSKYVQVKKFILEQQDTFLADTRYTDLFGYNVTWHPNSYFRKMK